MRQMMILAVSVGVAWACLAGEVEEKHQNEVKQIVESVLSAYRAGDGGKVKEAVAKVMPTRDDMLAVFPEKGDALWQKVQRVYAPDCKLRVAMTMLYQRRGVPILVRVTNLRTDKSSRWIYKDVRALIDAKFPAYVAHLRPSMGRRGEIWSTFVLVNGRWVWLDRIEKFAFDAYADKLTKMRGQAAAEKLEVDTALVPPQIKAFRNQATRQAATTELLRIGKPAGPALGALLKEEDKELRLAAVKALATISRRVGEPLPELAEALGNTDPEVCKSAIQGVGALGPKAEKAAPALARLLNREEPQIRRDAASALGRIGPAAVPLLLQALEDESPWARAGGAYALAMVHPPEKRALPLLIKALKEQDRAVQEAAARALERLGAETKTELPALIEALESASSNTFTRVAGAVAAIGPEAKDAVPALTQKLRQSRNDFERRAAAKALGKIGPGAKAALPVIQEVIDAQHRVYDLRIAALVARKQIEPAETRSVPALVEYINGSEARYRRAGLDALGQLGPLAEGAVPTLRKLLSGEDKSLRRSAVGVLGRMGAAAKEAVPDLCKLLDGDRHERYYIFRALGAIGPAAKEAIPTLERHLHGSYSHEVKKTLQKIRGEEEKK